MNDRVNEAFPNSRRMQHDRTKPLENLSASRRDFLKTSTAATIGLGMMTNAHAAGSDAIKVGLIGCGGRGTGAAENICEAAGTSYNIKLHAMADVFEDHLKNCREHVRNHELCKEKFDVTDDRSFVGFDAYQKVIDCCDLVMLATPPGFRPQHIEATIKAGKHLFAEKPVAVDGTGIRKVLAAYEEANKKGLSVVTGTQRRHQAGYIESMKRIHEARSATSWRPGLTGTRGTSGRTSASPAGATPSTRSATGITSSGCAATTSSNSTSIISTWPAGP